MDLSKNGISKMVYRIEAACLPQQKSALQSIKDNNRKFEEAGSRLPTAQQFFNCIHPPLFEIELSHVSKLFGAPNMNAHVFS